MDRLEYNYNRAGSDSVDGGQNAWPMTGNWQQEAPQRLTPHDHPRNNDSRADTRQVRRSGGSARPHQRPKMVACKGCR